MRQSHGPKLETPTCHPPVPRVVTAVWSLIPFGYSCGVNKTLQATQILSPYPHLVGQDLLKGLVKSLEDSHTRLAMTFQNEPGHCGPREEDGFQWVPEQCYNYLQAMLGTSIIEI